MKDPLTRLAERTSTLGNYNRKYLHIVSNNIGVLTDALEQHDVVDRVHLWSYSTEIPEEMDAVLATAANAGEALDFLSCYYALQFLHMNLRMVDIVKLDLATSSERSLTGRRLMLESGSTFRQLTKNYMQRLLDIFLDEQAPPEFVLMGVGTRSDQDDIDLGIVHRGPGDRALLNEAIARLASQMFKTATQLHFHLSEHVSGHGLTATIEDYEAILARENYDFVIVTEMLGAAAILGSEPLYEEFRRRVTDRFYHDPASGTNRHHEGYLRRILGEIHSLLKSPKPPETINPKEDGLRAIKGLLTALKLAHGVREVNAWRIIDDLRKKNPNRGEQYDDLENTLSFFETFRFLYQLMVAQDEDIPLHEQSIEQSVARIAEMIGFEKKGVVSAKDFMLVFYYEFLEKSVKAIEILTGDLKSHLQGISVCRPIFAGDARRKPGYKGNLALDFIQASTFFGGVTYWDDFLEELSAEDSRFFDEFVESFFALPEKLKVKVAAGYVSAIRYDPSSTLRFLVVLGRKAKNEKAARLFTLMSGMFIDELVRLPNASASLTLLSYSETETLNAYLALLDGESLDRLRALSQPVPAQPALAPLHGQLLALMNIHHRSSHFFKRHFYPILVKYPVYINKIHSTEKLREISSGLYGDLTLLESPGERIELLGDYYDMEFVRVSLMAMAGAGCCVTDAEFTEFCDNYTQTLYELCLEDAGRSQEHPMHFHDRFALYAAGGLAREQGFDDDYDMIVVLDSRDALEIEYCNRIVARMNSHILRRGILPHHRFSGILGSYTIEFDRLAGYLSGDVTDVFIEQSQILGSRMLVGSGKLEEKLMKKIISPFIFDRYDTYIERMRVEMHARHENEAESQRFNIKECRGGLRDIEMLLLMYKSKHRVRDPLTRKFLQSLQEIDPVHGQKFTLIEDHLNFLKNMRDLYRLQVAARDEIEQKHLASIAAIMGYGDGPEAAERLYDDFIERSVRAADVIEDLMTGILA